MALTFQPPFIQSAFDPSSIEIAVASSSHEAATDGTDVLTAGSNGAAFIGIHFKAQQALPNPTKILIQYFTGATRELIGEIIAKQDDAPTGEIAAWEGTWLDPQYQITGRARFIPSGDVIECCVFGSTVRKITATPLGGQL